jgi:hypothetical protein
VADHVQRIVEGLGLLLARIAAGRKAGRLDEAQREVADLAARVAGVNLDLLEVLGAPPIAAQLTDRRQLETLALLCEERAEIQAARGDPAGAARWRGHGAVFRGRA